MMNYHEIRSIGFNFPLLEEAYLSCCYGPNEPTAIYMNKENYKSLLNMIEGQNKDIIPPMIRFKNALISPTGIDNNIWIYNQEFYTEAKYNCLIKLK